jgi:hypothetical protein
MVENFSIRFTSDDPLGTIQEGQLVIASEIEGFESCIGLLSRDQYERGWVNALKLALFEREVACLIVDVVVDDFGNGRIHYFSLIPSEVARGAATFDSDSSGLFVTESLKDITIRPENLRIRRYIEFVDGSAGQELAVYFFDPSAPERFFLYLDSSVSNVWNRYVSNEEVRRFLCGDELRMN